MPTPRREESPGRDFSALICASAAGLLGGVKSFGELDTRLRLPDLWQQEGLHRLKEGQDVVIDAPTGSGKTYLVELLAETNRHGQIVLAVPTRALANDKLREWQAKGWRVGIVTGDVTRDPEAPLVVATLETQRPRFLRGEGPRYFVIDEYQMIGDPARGVSYEICVALAPPETRLLLLSGSVSNPQDVVAWLQRLGRDAALVSLSKRPVPLEEIHLDALAQNPPRSVVGFWPRLLAKALMADLGPILVFAPQRKAAEDLARQLAGALPIENPLALSPQQKRLAGGRLEKLLSRRVAFHHSGLSYQQRAGLVEPLAKAGQLRLVVATTGLAAGVNFSMRSALVTESQFTQDHAQHLIRPDELLQMFGRAGRRGLDTVGYALAAPDRPRLGEGRKLPIRRPATLDWPSLIGLMDAAARTGREPFAEAAKACRRLFNETPVTLGVEHSLTFPDAPCGLLVDAERARFAKPESEEFLNSCGAWEPLGPPREVPLRETFSRVGEKLIPALEDPECVRGIGSGKLRALRGGGGGKRFGKSLLLGYRDRKAPERVQLAGWLRDALAAAGVSTASRLMSLPELEALALGERLDMGELASLRWEGHRLVGFFDLAEKRVSVAVDVFGVGIANPETRKAYPTECQRCPELNICVGELNPQRSAALAWRQLALVDARGRPTRRGAVFSLFQGGEGLAIAAALEEDAYAVDAIAQDIANLRAGHRFEAFSRGSARLSRACRRAYSDRSYEGYLKHGLPTQYGEGAAEAIAEWSQGGAKGRAALSEGLRFGDMQRARLEWLSLLRHIARGPDVDWDRWRELQAAASALLENEPQPLLIDDLPPLEPSQMGRVSHLLRFPPRR